MKLPVINDWLTLIANLGVLIGVIAVVVELNQNTRAIRDSAIQSLDSGVLTVVNMLAADRENAVLFADGTTDFANLDRDEQIHYSALVNAICLRMDVSWFAFQNGLLPEQLWRREEDVLRELVNSPGGKAVWVNCNASQEFLGYVEQFLLD